MVLIPSLNTTRKSTKAKVNNTLGIRLTPVAFFRVLLRNYMSVDFKIISNTAVKGISLVMPMTEDAYHFIEDECDMNILEAGCAPIDSESVGDFISDSGWSKFTCELV